jgi:hypothetical protein
MPLIGRRDLFGIEYELNTSNDPLYLFGRLCFWFNGDQFGDFNAGVALADVQTVVTPIVKDAGRRKAPELWALSARDLFDGLLKAFREDRSEIAGIPVEMWDRFRIAPVLDIFDFRDAYAIANAGRYRVIYEHSSSEIREFEAHDTDVEGPLLEYWQQIDQLLHA